MKYEELYFPSLPYEITLDQANVPTTAYLHINYNPGGFWEAYYLHILGYETRYLEVSDQTEYKVRTKLWKLLNATENVLNISAKFIGD